MRPILSILLFAAGTAALCQAQVSLTPWSNIQYTDQSGRALSAGKVYTCVAGLACPGNPQATYTTSSGGTAHQNPITLDASGRPPGGQIWLTSSAAYKIVVTNAAGAVVTGAGGDNITGGSGGGGGGGGGNNWTLSGTSIFNSNPGAVGIGTSTPAFKLEVNGDILSNSQLILRTNEATLKYGGFKAPATIGTSYVMTLPANLPGAIGCMKLSPTGVISVDAACATGPTDTIWSVDMDNNVTLADSMTTVSALQVKNRTAGTGSTELLLVAGDNQTSGILRIRANDGNPDWIYVNQLGDFVSSKQIAIVHGNSTQPVLSFGANGIVAFTIFGETDDSLLKVGRYDGAGAFVDAPLTINRTTGDSSFLHTLNVTDAVCTGTCTGFGGGGGGSLPVIDTTSIVKGNITASKQMRFDVETLVSASSVRSLTVQDASYVISGTNIAQTISGVNTHTANILASGTPNIGSTTNTFSAIFGTAVFAEQFKIGTPGSLFTGSAGFDQPTTEITNLRDSAGTIIQSWIKTVPAHSVLEADFIPGNLNTLGRTGFRWGKLWTVDIDASGTTTLQNATCLGTCTGFGGGGGGANTALSNLGSVAVNAAINPSANNVRDFGASNLQWANSFINQMWSCNASTLSDCWRIQSTGTGTANSLVFQSPGSGGLVLGANGHAFITGVTSGTSYPLWILDTSSTPGINFYRNSVVKAASISSGATAAFSVQDQSDNFRFVVFQTGDVEIGSTTDHGDRLTVTGNLNVTTGIKANGTFGVTATYSVRRGDNSAACNLTVTFGLITGSTC